MMKRTLKVLSCLLMVTVLSVPSLFAAGLGTTSNIVKVGSVDNDDIIYDVDIEWGNLVYDFVKKDDGHGNEYYGWEVNEASGDTIHITNKSNVIVNANIEFNSSIPNVYGYMDSERSCKSSNAYFLLDEEPEDFNTTDYYEMNSDGDFVKIDNTTTFEANKYYSRGFGMGPYTDNNIPAKTNSDGTVEIYTYSYVLKLEGGSLSDVRPGATIGTVTLTLS